MQSPNFPLRVLCAPAVKNPLPTGARTAPTEFLVGCAYGKMKFIIPNLADNVRLHEVATVLACVSSIQKADFPVDVEPIRTLVSHLAVKIALKRRV